MTPLEELQAAHKRLSELHAAATAGPWGTSYDPGAYPRSAFARGYEVFKADTPESADLIVTLHRTIDAQLAVLDSAITAVNNWLDPDGPLGYEEWDGDRPPGPIMDSSLALARAINAEGS